MGLAAHGIVALIRNKAAKFLLLQEAREPLRGCWAPPHGRCEPTDATEEAGVVREVREETGLMVTPIRKVLTQPADTKITTVSFWIVDSEPGPPKLNGESSAWGWFDTNEALRLPLYPGTKLFFEKVKAGEIEL